MHVSVAPQRLHYHYVPAALPILAGRNAPQTSETQLFFPKQSEEDRGAQQKCYQSLK